MKSQELLTILILGTILISGCRPSHYSVDREGLRQECADVAVDYYLTFGRPPTSTQALDEGCSPDERRPCFPGLEVILDVERDLLVVKETEGNGMVQKRLSEAIIEANSPYRLTRFGAERGREMIVPQDENVIKYIASVFYDLSDEQVKVSEVDFHHPIPAKYLQRFKELSVSRKGNAVQFRDASGTTVWSAIRMLTPGGTETFRVAKGGPIYVQ